MRTALATLLMLIAGAGLLWQATDEARAFTSEGARRLAVRETPRSIPSLVLEDQTGSRFDFNRFRGKLLVVDFIYTACADLCVVAGNTLTTIRDALAKNRLGDEVALLSISFDSHRDTLPRLAYYAKRHNAEPDHWAVARASDSERLPELLKAFGVTVIPDRWGGFQHNSAIYVVNKEGLLTAIFDYDDPAAVLGFLENLS